MPENELRVLVADDDPLARVVLCRALTDGGLEVVAQAASGAEAVRLAEEHAPDVLVMDAALHDVADKATLSRRAPSTRLLMLANSVDPQTALESLRSGADGYLTRDLDLDVLPRIVRRVAAGETAVSRELTRALIDRLRSIPSTELGTRPVKSTLTSREWEVLDLMCQERSTASMADELCVTSETVRTHVKNILRKLGVTSRSDAAKLAGAMRRANGSSPPMDSRGSGPRHERPSESRL